MPTSQRNVAILISSGEIRTRTNSNKALYMLKCFKFSSINLISTEYCTKLEQGEYHMTVTAMLMINVL